jgi:ABC-type branched-subunit amino acid transport system substrate-binding protein
MITRALSAAAAAFATVAIAALTAATASAQTASISGPGVDAGTVTLGLAVPITGTGVNYGTKFEDAANAYWKWAAAQGKRVAGHTVKIIVQDDQLRPDTATQVCTRFSENAFLIVGWQGSNNAKACAAAASRAGTPFVTRGNDPTIGEFPTYFATSPTYVADAEIIARFIKDHMGGPGTKVQFGAFSASTNDVLVQSFDKAAKEQGLQLAPAVRVGFTSSSAEQVTAALQIRDAGTQVAAMIFSPGVLATVFSTWNAQNYHPKLILYVNDQQVDFLCGALTPQQTAELYTLSPWPTVEYAEKVQPGFRAAFKQYGGGKDPDSNDISIWATMAFVDAMLQKAGPNITRETFMQRVGNATIETPMLGPVAYKPGNHIDAGSQFMQQLSCQNKALVTLSHVGR